MIIINIYTRDLPNRDLQVRPLSRFIFNEKGYVLFPTTKIPIKYEKSSFSWLSTAIELKDYIPIIKDYYDSNENVRIP